jgi:pyruvate/2-oxoglutarate dehydrogenase complex dihydrolipoamide dehydrogenase (E3) component
MTDENSMAVEPMDEHNRVLVENTHPAGWTNPVPRGRYNLVVIGAGAAGLVTAVGAAGLGAKVALIERNLLGGDCLNYGCVPSKALLRAAKSAAERRNAAKFGATTGDVNINFAAVMERVRRVRSEISAHDSAARFTSLGIDVYFGEARFVDSTTIEVNGQRLAFRSAVIATGARPFVPEIPGLRDARYFTNETIFTLTEQPKRMIVLGGGPIGCELAQAFQRLGTNVTIVEAVDRLLPREGDDAGAVVRSALERDGATILTNSTLAHVANERGEQAAVIRDANGEHRLPFDAILVAVGRAPNVDGMNLSAVGVAYDAKSGVKIDDFLATTNPSIYAVGDVCLPLKFTHAADASARAVIRNALFGFAPRQRFSMATIPWCTYTDPEVAHIGISERDASNQNIAIDTIHVPMADMDRARTDGCEEGFLKIHLAKGTDRIAGATIVCPNAGELIGLISIAMSNGLGLRAIGGTVLPYPTLSESIRRAADAHNRTRLTPAVARLFKTILGWRR